MVLLGFNVRGGATGVDGWFQRGQSGPLGALLVLTDYRTASALLFTSVVVALYRRLWALLPLIVIVPVVASAATETLKPLFGRMKGDSLAYPSGHTTQMIVVLGLLILAFGARRWILLTAAVFALLGVVGQATTYHYFTDAMGSLLLGTSLVCVAAVSLRWLQRPPRRLRLRLRR